MKIRREERRIGKGHMKVQVIGRKNDRKRKK